VVLIDFDLLLFEGISMLVELRKEKEISLIMLSFLFLRCNNSGRFNQSWGKGILSKRATDEELVCSITSVVNNEFFSNEQIVNSIFQKMTGNSRNNDKGVLNNLFSARELEVIKLLGDGFSSKEIGKKLYLSPRTIEDIRHCLMEKSNAKNTVSLYRFAVKNGIINL